MGRERETQRWSGEGVGMICVWVYLDSLRGLISFPK